MLALIDGNYYAYRYFFGAPALVGPGGRPTGVTSAFADMIKSLRESPDITHWALVFDPHGPTFRHEIYEEYKAQRDPMPELLKMQIPDIEKIAGFMGIPLVNSPGYEADDTIANLAARTAGDLGVRICSKDKDLDQVLNDRIVTWDPGKKIIRGPAELKEEKGIDPEQVIDYLCMIGDSADNVPGIKGVGPKTAVKLLTKFGSLENILANTDQLKGKQKENVEAFASVHELTRKLITIPLDIPDLPKLEELEIGPLNETPEFRAYLDDLGFRPSRFLPRRRIGASDGAQYRILSVRDLPEFLDELSAAGRFAVDTETTGLDPHTAEIVGISFAHGAGDGREAAYLPFQGTEHSDLANWEEVAPLLTPILENPSIGKIMQNGKYDYRVFLKHGVTIQGYDGDPLLASWLLDPSRESHGLDYLTRSLLSEDKIPTSELLDPKSEQTIADVPVKAVATYASEDAQCTWRLAQLLEEKLKEVGLLDVYRQQELPMAVCLAEIEHAGLPVDRRILDEKAEHLTLYLNQLVVEIQNIAGKDFNPGSPKQVAQQLFEKLGLPIIRKTKSGPSTDAKVLKALRHHHELPNLILQHRTLAKLVNSYLKTLPDTINPITKRIHTSLKQTGTETGRLSSEGPNLQNIPKKKELGREIRAAFHCSEDRLLLAADYSQIELRVLAHFSQDPTLQEAFTTGVDIHRFVAAQVNHCPEDEVTPAMRDAAKAVNFGIIYGQTAFGLAGELGISRGEAKKFIDGYFDRFGEVREFIDGVIDEAADCGYIETISGRRRYLPGLQSPNRNERNQAERMALNSTIQGSAADLIKKAMLRCRTMLPSGANLVLQIHDELIVETTPSSADEAAEALREAMIGAADLHVPLITEVKSGHSWFDISS